METREIRGGGFADVEDAAGAAAEARLEALVYEHRRVRAGITRLEWV